MNSNFYGNDVREVEIATASNSSDINCSPRNDIV